MFDTAVRSTRGTPVRGCLPFITLWAFLSQVLDIPELLATSPQKRLHIYRTLLKVIAHKAVSVDALSGLSSDIAQVEVNHESVNVAQKFIP
ncbi:hypothetical protein [uncultured Nostoc sp.]|uniref:hypothetical protein n=1 Tax=uncultured Nostoc sp. TaxID=340711 RepID=UPI00262E9304|nr:hypothetical protein [uncultured Nostoc sp.]